MGKFKKLGLSKEVLKILDELGFEKPTEIQEQAIPRLLGEDRDLIGLAQTGTGKTAAFGLPLIERIDPKDKNTQGLILAPTRELGKQIAEQLAIFSKYLPKINVLAVYGGASIMDQIRALRKPQHIIIATPGRLIDLIKRKSIYLDELKFLVLDEADEMLNMGFKDELDKILSYTPEEKQTWLFSATMPSHIKKIVKTYMDDPIDIRVNTKNEVNKNIKHIYTSVRNKDKLEALTRFIDLYDEMRAVIFCRTKRETQAVAEELLFRGYKADAIHGDLSQAQRDRVMKRFKKHDLELLIATDVAARGIDVNDLTHVFHHTLPDDDSYYTHRSGRTARAGKKGVSIVFINGGEDYKITRLERQLDISIKKIQIPDNSEIASIRVKRWCEKLKESSSSKSKHMDETLVEQAQILLDEMTKDELIEAILAKELKSMKVGSSKDLNDDSKGGGSRGRGRDRGGRSGGGRGRSGGGGRGRGRDRGGRGDGRRRSDSGGGSGRKKYGKGGSGSSKTSKRRKNKD